MSRALVFITADGGVTQGAVTPADVVETIAVVPGDAVALHWIELPPLAPAQALAAARLLAADVSAVPIETVHVALGPVEADGWRVLALVDAGVMAGWLAALAAAGVAADRVVPAPLLLEVPEEGVAVLESGGQWLVRGQRLAFAAEPAQAQMMIGDAMVQRVEMAAVPAAALIDLRQGVFARRQPWRVGADRVRRLAVLALALAGVLLAVQVAGLLRYSFAADRAELQLADAARQVLPRGTVVTAPQAQVAARLAQLGGGGAGFAGPAAAVAAALRNQPAVVLHSLEYAPATGLVAVMTMPADRAALAAALADQGYDASFGTPDRAGGAPLVEMRVRPR